MTQTYASHRRYMPWHHFVVQPILIINVAIELSRLMDDRTGDNAWRVVLAIGLLLLSFTSRIMALKAQDRVIRLEERIRLARLLPPEEQSRIDSIPVNQLVALRFASDEELPALARRCIAGELKSGKEIKQSITSWRPDYLRV